MGGDERAGGLGGRVWVNRSKCRRSGHLDPGSGGREGTVNRDERIPLQKEISVPGAQEGRPVSPEVGSHSEAKPWESGPAPRAEAGPGAPEPWPGQLRRPAAGKPSGKAGLRRLNFISTL